MNSRYEIHSDMDHLTFVPAGNEFFLWADDAIPGAQRSEVAERLTRAGWPSAARMVGGPDGGRHLEGTLIEMIDALPILASGPTGASTQADLDLPPSMLLYSGLLRRGLELVGERRLLPILRARPGDRDARPSGWEARWEALSGPMRDDPLWALAHGIGRSGGTEVAVVLGRLVSVRQLAEHQAGRLLRRVLDACADVLVREAAWRGAVVRLAGWPADAWEQRLVHALCDLHPVFASGPCSASFAAELREWTQVQAEGSSLLPSPPSWHAPESLLDVLRRIVAPAAYLAQQLLHAQPAPRTLIDVQKSAS